MTECTTQRVWFLTRSSPGFGLERAGRALVAVGWNQKLDPWKSLITGADFPEGE